ncbi:MAG: MFS transporter [Deltaproteobacteria bacterium]|nr:MFS transporter [Deltaproteobacteria bacterium]MBW2445338.1 MFS transporter [Deltaproteobacteria bacterium]
MDRPPLFTRVLALAFVANFLQGTAFNLFLNLPGYLTGLGATKTQIGLIWGITAASAILSRPTVGRMMDQRGRRVVFLVGGVLNVAVCGLYLTVTEIGPWIALIRIIHGISEAMLFSSLFTYAADRIPVSRRTEGIALFGISGLLSISVGAALGEATEIRFGYDGLFLAAVALAAGSLLLTLPLRDLGPEDGEDELPHGFLAALGQRDLLPLWMATAVFATALAAPFTFMKSFVAEAGFGSMATFFNAYSISGVLLRLLFAGLPDRIGPKRALFPAMGTLGVGFVLLTLATSGNHVLAAGVFCGLGHGLTFPILMGLVVSRARDADRGAAMAIFTALFDLGMLLGGPLFGVLIDARGFSPAFGVGFLLLAIGGAAFALWDRGNATS